MSDFRETLTTHGFDAIFMLLKICVDLMISFITLELIGVFVPLMRYLIFKIFRYNLD